MSYAIQAYNLKALPKVADGHRLVVATYKERKIREKGKPERKLPAFAPLCAVVPTLPVYSLEGASETTKAVNELLTSYLADMQEALFKSLIDERRSKDADAAHLNRKLELMAEEVDIAAVVEYAKSKGAGKLTKEAIGAYFDSVLAAELEAKFLEPMVLQWMEADPEHTNVEKFSPTADQQKSIDANVATYRELVCKLAATQVKMGEDNRKALRRLLNLAPEGDQMATRLILVLDRDENKEEKLAAAF